MTYETFNAAGQLTERCVDHDNGTATLTKFTNGVQTSSETINVPVTDPRLLNEATLRAALAVHIAPGSPARNAVASNATFIAAAKPGTAALQASAAYDQAKALANQNNVIIPGLLRVIRLVLGDVSDTT